MHNTITTTGPDGTHPTTVIAPSPVADDYRPSYNQGKKIALTVTFDSQLISEKHGIRRAFDK